MRSDPGPGANLLGHIHTLLSGGQLGDQLGDVLAGPLGLQAALLPRFVLDDSLDRVVADRLTRHELTASRCAQLYRLLVAAGDGRVLLLDLLGDAAHLPRPLLAPGVCDVADGLRLALSFQHGLAADHVVLHFMNLGLGPALGLVLGPADLGALNVAVLHQRSSADLNSLVESDLLVVNETILPEVLLALLLLLGLVVGDVGGVAPRVVAVVAMHLLVVFDHVHRDDLVNTSLAVSSGGGSSHRSKAHIDVIGSLSLGTAGETLGLRGMGMVTVTVAMSVVVIGVEGEGVDERLTVSADLLAPQPPGPEDTLSADDKNKKQLK